MVGSVIGDVHVMERRRPIPSRRCSYLASWGLSCVLLGAGQVRSASASEPHWRGRGPWRGREIQSTEQPRKSEVRSQSPEYLASLHCIRRCEIDFSKAIRIVCLRLYIASLNSVRSATRRRRGWEASEDL
eukprot:459901-Prymnesium_polylepis.1